MNSRRARAIAFAIVIVGALVAIIVSADREMMPASIARLYDWPGGDKLGHFVLMGAAAFAVELALGGRRVALRIAGHRLSLRLAPIVVGAAVIAEECSQLALPSRTFSFLDLAFSLAGVVAGGALATALLGRRSARARGPERGE